jgi:hypothetical protein
MLGMTVLRDQSTLAKSPKLKMYQHGVIALTGSHLLPLPNRIYLSMRRVHHKCRTALRSSGAASECLILAMIQTLHPSIEWHQRRDLYHRTRHCPGCRFMFREPGSSSESHRSRRLLKLFDSVIPIPCTCLQLWLATSSVASMDEIHKQRMDVQFLSTSPTMII